MKNSSKFQDFLDLFWVFMKISSVNFGGGYAMLPLLERELAKKRNWVSVDELMDYYAIGQCTPGIIALNVSTFIGYKKRGVLGGIVASLGFLSMPILIILLIAAFLTNFADLPIVQHAFAGVRVCVFVLVLQAVRRLWKKAIIDPLTFGIFLVVFLIAGLSFVLPFTVPTALLVVAAGLVGVFFGKEA